MRKVLSNFLVALGVEESGLHRRLALRIVATVGDSPRRLLLGFMTASAALSMWLSNTATTVMLLPIALSVLWAGVSGPDEGRRAEGDDDKGDGAEGETASRTPFGAALMLGIAYAASIGGFATLIGTPTNVAFRGLYEEAFTDAPEISFGGWTLMALPLSIVLLVVAWAVIAFVTIRFSNQRFLGGPSTISQQLADLGPMRTSERRMAIIFAITAALWIFRQPVAGFGWAPWLGVSEYATDATVAITMAVVCFVIPAQRWRGPALLGWECTRRVPWGILLLFGGGLALAEGMKASGLDIYLGERLGSQVAGMRPSVAATLTSLAMTFLSELTSNVACVNMSMPVLATTAQTAGCDPRLLMIPATLAASCAFMLPVATPPNAIIYGSGQVRVADMIRTGLVLNLLCPPLIVACVILLGGPILGISLDGLPDWAAPVEARPASGGESSGAQSGGKASEARFAHRDNPNLLVSGWLFWEDIGSVSSPRQARCATRSVTSARPPSTRHQPTHHDNTSPHQVLPRQTTPYQPLLDLCHDTLTLAASSRSTSRRAHGGCSVGLRRPRLG